MSAWPSSSCTTRRSAPWLSRWVAKAWRSVCGEMACADAGLRRVALDQVPERLARHRPPRAVTNSASLCLPSQQQRPRLCDVAPRPSRAPPRPPAPAAPCCPCRGCAPRPCPATLRHAQRHQLGDAQAAGIEHLQHRPVAQAQRRLHVAAQPAAASTSCSVRLLGRLRGSLRRVDVERGVGFELALAQRRTGRSA